ncbi:hypothetical protein ELH47_11155 [Rhizobium ruizarguesonis]|nr:hypothetical protein ELH47_11155 [Rhizobium ruizarguesonis]
MQRYEIQALENGMWSVMDRQTGKPIADREGASQRTRLAAQALADFRNGMFVPPAKERVSLRLQKIRRAWELVSGKRQP